jgi:hypothetical protein
VFPLIAALTALAVIVPIRSQIDSCGDGGRYSLLLGQHAAYEDAINEPEYDDSLTPGISNGVCVVQGRYSLHIL